MLTPLDWSIMLDVDERMHIVRFLVFVVAALGFLTLVGLGPWHATQMTMDEEGLMRNCIFDVGEQSICTMDVFEHLGFWHRLLVAVPQKVVASTVLAMFLAVLTAGFWYRRQSLIADVQGVSEQIYSHQDFRLKLFDYLHQAFSHGILHTKIY